MPVTDVAYASGFKSLRRFNALLKQRYRLTPTEFRKQQKKEVPQNFTEFSFRLSYRPPLTGNGFWIFFRGALFPMSKPFRTANIFGPCT